MKRGDVFIAGFVLGIVAFDLLDKIANTGFLACIPLLWWATETPSVFRLEVLAVMAGFAALTKMAAVVGARSVSGEGDQDEQ